MARIAHLEDSDAAIINARLEFDIDAHGFSTWIDGKRFFTEDGFPVTFRREHGGQVVVVTVHARPEIS